MSTPKTRIIQFIDYQKISRRTFCEKIGVSHTYFSNNSSLSSDVMENIFTNYPELNMDWVITGRGEMIAIDLPKHLLNEENEEYPLANWKQKYYDLLERYTSLLEQVNKLKDTG